MRCVLIGAGLWAACGLAAGDVIPAGAIELRRLAADARSKDEVTRGKAVAKLFPRLKRGKPRKAVEALIGPPHHTYADRAVQQVSEKPLRYFETYYAWYATPPGGPGKPERRGPAGLHLMTVIYERTDAGDVFVEVTGPHVPD